MLFSRETFENDLEMVRAVSKAELIDQIQWVQGFMRFLREKLRKLGTEDKSIVVESGGSVSFDSMLGERVKVYGCDNLICVEVFSSKTSFNKTEEEKLLWMIIALLGAGLAMKDIERELV